MLQVLFIGIGMIYDSPSGDDINLNDMGKIAWYPGTTKHKKGSHVHDFVMQYQP